MLSQRERIDIDDLARRLTNKLRVEDSSVTGFNIGWNIGTDEGQTVAHAHMHLIPRRWGDVADPTGGIRGVIPSKQRY
jgi:ATP adenylyltransferase